VLIIVQNLPVPLDRRVWLEAQALRDHGCDVAVICPAGPGDPPYECLDGVHLYKYRPPPPTRGVASFFVEFALCWLCTAWLALRVRRRHGIDVIQTCNPPDTYFALAAPFKAFGVRFVFDQHDLCPEMFFSRFGRDTGGLAACLRLLERATYALADHVIAPNESYAKVAQTRGKKPTNEVTVVRSAPDPDAMAPLPPTPALKRDRPFMICWLGIMGPQDGVQLLLDAARHYIYELGRRDCHFAILGFGDEELRLRRQCTEMGLDAWVTFTGRADQEMIAAYLSTADLGVVPDDKTPYADLSTHNKTMEYMAFALPVVTCDLSETVITAGDAGHIVPAGDVEGLAVAFAELLDDPERRRTMGDLGRQRIERDLSWHRQAEAYVDVYDRLLHPLAGADQHPQQ
jgi:glycosyltransferase involved in cell wall biosynthesis